MNSPEHSAGYTVYWQPGCSSCLRAKEFLKNHDIDFESINIREVTGAMEQLEHLGARSIPVVSRGDEFVYAQDIDVLAGFVGVDSKRRILAVDDLYHRIELLIDAAQRYLLQLDSGSLDNTLPGRDRSYFALGYHVLMIPLAYMDALKGEELSYDYFERTPPAKMDSIEKLNHYGDELKKRVSACRQEADNGHLPDTVQTYYGVHTTHSVLERTAWHTAHHVRQLMELVRAQGIEPDGPLGDVELKGLPLPEEVYDDEVAMT